jgi:hypothetical protein
VMKIFFEVKLYIDILEAAGRVFLFCCSVRERERERESENQ